MKDTREFQTIKVEVEDALGRLTLNRPERLNAVGATMLQEMAEAARWFDSHRGEFAGLKPTGRRVEVTEINLSRFRDGLMVEHWAVLDEASMMRQLAGR